MIVSVACSIVHIFTPGINSSFGKESLTNAQIEVGIWDELYFIHNSVRGDEVLRRNDIYYASQNNYNHYMIKLNPPDD